MRQPPPTHPTHRELHPPEQRHQAWLTPRTGSPLYLSWAGFQVQPATLSPGKNHYLQGEGAKGEGGSVDRDGQSWEVESTGLLGEPLFPCCVCVCVC